MIQRLIEWIRDFLGLNRPRLHFTSYEERLRARQGLHEVDSEFLKVITGGVK